MRRLTMPARSEEPEFVTVPEFAKRVHRDKHTIYQRIREKKMPKGTVFLVLGHIEVDWKAWVRSLREAK
jgi:hypothetical protein